jgi:hypothetical protein
MSELKYIFFTVMFFDKTEITFTTSTHLTLGHTVTLVTSWT